jgi:hypothetical protein
MPILKNTRHEKFAQELAKGKSATKAYRAAGFKGDRTAASRMSTNVNISKRVAELQGKAAERTITTVEALIDKTRNIQGQAMANLQFKVALDAVEAEGRLAGLWPDPRIKMEVQKAVYAISDCPLSAAEWAEKFCDAHDTASMEAAGVKTLPRPTKLDAAGKRKDDLVRENRTLRTKVAAAEKARAAADRG